MASKEQYTTALGEKAIKLGKFCKGQMAVVMTPFLPQLDPPRLVHLLAEITAVWGSFTHRCVQFPGHELQRAIGDRDARPGAEIRC